MAETTRLSVGKALDKLRDTDAPEAKLTRLDAKMETLDEEIRQMRATRSRLERDQKLSSARTHAQKTTSSSVIKSKALWIVVGIAFVLLVAALI